MTSPERLAQLMPWVNGDALSVAAQRQVLSRFLLGFKTSALYLPKDVGMWDVEWAKSAELDATRHRLAVLLHSGFAFDAEHRHWSSQPIEPDDVLPPMSFPSLRFGALRVGQRKQFQARYVMHVNATRLRDLVPFLVLHVLTTEDIYVGRCQAPARGNWKARCDRLFIWTKKGRPSQVCPPMNGRRSACRDRVKAMRKQQQLRKMSRSTRRQR